MLLGEPLDGAGKRLCAREIRRPGQLRELADRRRCEAFSGARRRSQGSLPQHVSGARREVTITVWPTCADALGWTASVGRKTEASSLRVWRFFRPVSPIHPRGTSAVIGALTNANRRKLGTYHESLRRRRPVGNSDRGNPQSQAPRSANALAARGENHLLHRHADATAFVID